MSPQWTISLKREFKQIINLKQNNGKTSHTNNFKQENLSLTCVEGG